MEIFFLFRRHVTRNQRVIFYYKQFRKNAFVFVSIFPEEFKIETYL